jgi:hypothetical protein
MWLVNLIKTNLSVFMFVTVCDCSHWSIKSVETGDYAIEFLGEFLEEEKKVKLLL